MPSRLVSIFRLSIVRFSTPVARISKWPPCRMEKSRRSTLWQFFRLMDLLPTPGFMAPCPRLSPLPQMRPVPVIRMFSMCSPQRQAVMEVTVAEILKLVPGVGLGRVVTARAVRGRIGRDNGGARHRVAARYCSSDGWRSTDNCRPERRRCRRPPQRPLRWPYRLTVSPPSCRRPWHRRPSRRRRRQHPWRLSPICRPSRKPARLPRLLYLRTSETLDGEWFCGTYIAKYDDNRGAGLMRRVIAARPDDPILLVMQGSGRVDAQGAQGR